MATQSNTNVIVWSLYDFANSIVSITFVVYFSQWLVVDKGFTDLTYNAILASVSAALLLTAPALGHLADASRSKAPALKLTTVIMMVAFLGTTAAVILYPTLPWIAAFGYFAAQYFYQLSFVFYNALLLDLSDTRTLGRVSGIGQTANWIGQVAGILLTVPFVAGAFTIFGAPGRTQVFLPAVLASILLALPLLIFFKDSGKQRTANAAGTSRRELWSSFRALIRVPGMGAFLLAYFLFTDALVTTAANFPLYLQNVFGASDQQKILLILGTLISASVFALLAGYFADRFGLWRVLTILVAAWAIILPLQAVAPNVASFFVLQILVGGSFGGIAALARAVMCVLCPRDQISFGFSLFTIAERGGAIIGPLTWGVLVDLLETLGTSRYRVAVASMALFVVAGLIALRRATRAAAGCASCTVE